MHPSDSFLHKLRKIRKQLAEDEDGAEAVQQRVREAFYGSVPSLPEAMVEELFLHFCRRLTGSSGAVAAGEAPVEADHGGPHEELDRLEALADVVDLLNEDYDEERDPLDAADWPVIRDVCSDYAVELNMRTVSYVMRLVVDHGAVR